MKYLNLSFICFCVTILFSAESANAIDIVKLTGETNRRSGEITSVNKEGLVLKSQLGKEEKIAVSDIEYIEWDGMPAKYKGALGQENNGRLQEALEEYQAVVESLSSPREFLRAELQFAIARVLAKQAMQGDHDLADAIAQVKSFTTKNITSLRYYPAVSLLGELYLLQQDYLQAETAFNSIMRSPLTELQQTARLSLAKVRFTQGSIDEALKMYEEVIKSAQGDDKFRAQLGKAGCLTEQKKYPAAETLLNQVIANASRNDQTTQAEAHVFRGECYLGMDRPQHALTDFLMVEILFPGETEMHARALYHLTSLWKRMGETVRSQNALAKLENSYPKSKWAKQATP